MKIKFTHTVHYINCIVSDSFEVILSSFLSIPLITIYTLKDSIDASLYKS